MSMIIGDFCCIHLVTETAKFLCDYDDNDYDDYY